MKGMRLRKLFISQSQLLCGIVLIVLSSCAHHNIVQNGETKRFKNIDQYVRNSAVLQDHLTGLMLYDAKKKETIYSHNADKYFTPASNTKLWTFYTALNTLGDSIQWMAYSDLGKRRIYFPMGDASFLNPFLPPNPRIENYFANEFNKGDTIYMSTIHYRDDRFGAGWMWDDQSYYFQAEKSVFPIHANSVKLTPDKNKISHIPGWISISTQFSNVDEQKRSEYKNEFFLPKNQTKPAYVPVVVNPDYYRAYFNSLNLHVEFVDEVYNRQNAEMIYSIPSDDIYQYFMEESDNLIAEQLLLQCSMEKLGYMSTHDIIDTLMKSDYSEWQDEWNWTDGSGISRYNLVTPNAMVELMNALLDQYDTERVKQILPSGGEGTLSNWYGYQPPRVFAKSGTVRYCHNLTGVIETKNGNEITFSFMHNNFNYSSSVVKKAMSDIIDIVVELY